MFHTCRVARPRFCSRGATFCAEVHYSPPLIASRAHLRGGATLDEKIQGLSVLKLVIPEPPVNHGQTQIFSMGNGAREGGNTMERLWRGSAEALERLCRGSGKALQRFRRGFAEALERLWRGSEEALERLWRGSGEALQRLWRGSGEALERLWRSSGTPIHRLIAEVRGVRQ